MITRKLLLTIPLVAFVNAGAFAAPPSESLGGGHAHASGTLATNEERCIELMRQFDVAPHDAVDQARLRDAMALRQLGGSMCQYRSFDDGVAKLDEALAMLGQAPSGSAE